MKADENDTSHILSGYSHPQQPKQIRFQNKSERLSFTNAVNERRRPRSKVITG